ncbi:hypothetical protein P153DRAFT_362266 [Dothidotthia symphoricarpi CBS 119687]|uniref:Uncharacterized protein n=1 Tax=Dothidotthia symphoricarpi CBS 119687 TaxID=1392245 RepID=A0A6A6ARQ3_9PLEO|nr:uncharacterized protein P153DRAFT_362266 [Dothidotthia symphoricarpi CBS 119687]KAF2134500.1 hypothetical protein P153DRAFT_362266 [Dothidotthia symphoricarpi CBS 119687]
MTTIPPLRRHVSQYLHRHHSNRMKRVDSAQDINAPKIFEGTDAVSSRRRVALQRVIEAHDALGLSNHNDFRPTPPSSDVFNLSSTILNLPNGELRAFTYLLRLWDPRTPSDPDFDAAVAPSRLQCEEALTKHFFRRIAMWNASEEVLMAAKQDMAKRFKRNESEEKNGLWKLWSKEKERHDNTCRDALKEVTTREGLAQLLWTLLHDAGRPLAPGLGRECKEAVKKMYGIAT